MNLKEAFRYQNYINGVLADAVCSLRDPRHSTKVTKTHLRSKVDSNLSDIVEVVDPGYDFFKNDDVIGFLDFLTIEKESLLIAIGKAKASIGFDLDAEINSNKFRREVASQIATMLKSCGSNKRNEKGIGYRFNSDGEQVQYYYDVEVETIDAFDRAGAKDLVRRMSGACDRVSTEIESKMINTNVNFKPAFDVNDSFEDTMERYLKEVKISD